jgi:hypothetical protein
MNKILPIILSDQSNYEFIWDSLCAQSLATFLDKSFLQERSSRRLRRYNHMKFSYSYIPMCTASSRRNRRLFYNDWDKVYVEKYNIQLQASILDETQSSELDDIDKMIKDASRITWKTFIPSLSSIIEFFEFIFDKEFWKKIYKSKSFREGLKDEFIEMVYDYAVWPIAIVGIIYLYTLI